MHRPTEITDFDLSVYSHQDVLRLDVSVHDMLLVQIFQGRGHLCDVLGSLPLGKAFLFPKELVKLSLSCEFKDKEYALRIVEVPVESEDIGMAKIRLYLDFPSDLFLDLPLLKFGFVKDFEGAYEASRLLSGEVDSTEFALA